MASDSPNEPRDAAAEAQRLAAALDAIEAELDRLEPGASPSVVARALAGPVKAFDAAAGEVLR